MTVFDLILLALTAGLTEIFPVSGTGHFSMLERVLGITLSQTDRSLLQGMLWLGTALALLLYYRRQVGAMLRQLPAVFGRREPGRRSPEAVFAGRQLLLLGLSSLPLLLGLPLRGLSRSLAERETHLLCVGLLLALSGTKIFFAGRAAREKVNLQQMTAAPALVLGLVQAAALLPGLSRTGMVLSAALAMGFTCQDAVEYAGLMGIPAFLSAGLLSCLSPGPEAVTLPAAMCFAAFFLAAAAALPALRLLTGWMKTGRPTGFAYWCWGAGILSLVLFLISV